MKSIKKHNKILFRIAKHSVSCHKLNNIKKILYKALQIYDSINISRSDSNSYLYSDIK